MAKAPTTVAGKSRAVAGRDSQGSCECSRPIWRYYWMCLIHWPITVWTQGLFASIPISPVLKFVIVLTVTTVATLLTYHVFVRATAVRAMLNGRRFDRARPPLHAGGAWELDRLI